jgi:hypothetical protein
MQNVARSGFRDLRELRGIEAGSADIQDEECSAGASTAIGASCEQFRPGSRTFLILIALDPAAATRAAEVRCGSQAVLASRFILNLEF